MKGIFAALKEDYAEKNNGLVPLEILKESDRMQEKECGDEYCTRVDGSLQKKEIPEKQKTKYVFVPGVISLKRLLNHYFLRNWSSKMIKKSLEAYFFTLKNKIVFCKKQF